MEHASPDLMPPYNNRPVAVKMAGSHASLCLLSNTPRLIRVDATSDLFTYHGQKRPPLLKKT
ncbi:hypothetical protein E2C01_084580 [Portunus trituberculatus]|uniref:Uncharacterized protein n=1 Tax=Portunus trituberculatus TaxID=210409 RepID=A0A5B7J6P0_PORTR|nr:hypothetical protein [Portunus trituberculatus]